MQWKNTPGVLEIPRTRSCSNTGPPAESWLYGLWRLYSSRRPEGHRRVSLHAWRMHDAPHGGPATRYSTTQTSALYIQLIPVPSTRRNPQSATVCSATFQWIHLRPIINHLPGMAFHMAAIHPSCTCNGRIPRGAQAAPSETLLGCWANARYTQAAPSETLLGCWANAESWLYDL